MTNDERVRQPNVRLINLVLHIQITARSSRIVYETAHIIESLLQLVKHKGDTINEKEL